MARVHTYRVLDRDYPHALRDLASPPDPLCVRGELMPGPAVAIVGTRHPSNEAQHYAHQLAFRLARRGVAVWSGGAKGIDEAAHRGALDAGGLSVAVVATGLEHCYPKEHAPLYERIVAASGAIVSPFELSHPATYPSFHYRNGVLAALTQATVVVQAAMVSGARSTASHARRMHRPLFVLPASPWDEASAGNIAELDLGARALTNERELFKLLGVPPPHSPPPAAPTTKAAEKPADAAELTLLRLDRGLDQAPEGLAETHRTVLEATKNRPRHVDDLCAETGLTAALVHEALLTLTLEAVLVEGPTGWFRRVSVR
jgi:DNA processing protein